ncbi:SRPBCC family protein [Micromonospora olivasterospora]|uniref:Polyketide cyclase/dehydrase/lipid transport protein n=1 Tax=Micromonospora olivasterospora TaxID=1880 RepID=A0A562IDM3_MICOL|nr:SRPBCC family protein [Micromonospora olivasterospora]TWH69099.1 polyketide cyclase/dehydrase/lipid transport protein [Micromonospora olivasterospora]
MRFEVATEISADVERVWAVLADVERWPEWTASVRSARRLEPGPLTVGSTARLEQPRLRTAVWRVVAAEPPHGFVWVSRAPGVRTRGGHRIVPLGDGRVRVELTLEQSGLLARPVGWRYGELVRRYLGMEAEGLRRRCEQG